MLMQILENIQFLDDFSADGQIKINTFHDSLNIDLRLLVGRKSLFSLCCFMK